MPGSRHALRILDIDFTTGTTNNDIFEVDALTFYRDAQSRSASLGFSVDAVVSNLEGGTTQALNAGVDLVSLEAWIWLSETIPPPSVIILDLATTAS